MDKILDILAWTILVVFGLAVLAIVGVGVWEKYGAIGFMLPASVLAVTWAGHRITAS